MRIGEPPRDNFAPKFASLKLITDSSEKVPASNRVASLRDLRNLVERVSG